MAANALVQARIDGEIKKEAAAVLESMGLTISDAVRLMLILVAREKELPFSPRVPNAVTVSAMQECLDGNVSSADTIGELMARLNADD